MINTEHDGFAVDDELLDAVLARGLDDPRMVVNPVVAAARDQKHAVAVATEAASGNSISQ